MGPLATDGVLVAALEAVASELDAASDGPVRLGDIASAMGLSERALRAKFTATIGIPPMRYLRLRRLTMARRTLQQAASEGVTVTEVALLYRFSELGRFAAAYRDRFGEHPSVTLRRSLNRVAPHNTPMGDRTGKGWSSSGVRRQTSGRDGTQASPALNLAGISDRPPRTPSSTSAVGVDLPRR